MELKFFFITFLCSFKMSISIRCHVCDPEYSYNRRIPTCDHFAAGDDTYVTDCPRSTMCSKRVTTLDVGNGIVSTSTSVERSCASQTTEGEQRKVNRGWENVNTVYEPYEEGCVEDPRNAERPTKTVFCYCRGDLCNRGGKTASALSPIVLSLAIILGNS